MGPIHHICLHCRQAHQLILDEKLSGYICPQCKTIQLLEQILLALTSPKKKKVQ